MLDKAKEKGTPFSERGKEIGTQIRREKRILSAVRSLSFQNIRWVWQAILITEMVTFPKLIPMLWQQILAHVTAWGMNTR